MSAAGGFLPRLRSALVGPSLRESRGYRPFFLAAAGFGALAIAWWLAILAGATSLAGPLPPALWHAHEMIFGYLVAVLSGFLLTTTRGWRVWLLAALWLAGRAAMAATATSPAPWAAALDLAYLPALALLRDPPLWRRAKWPTAGFLPLLIAFFAVDVAFHLDALGLAPGAAGRAFLVAVDLMALLIAVIAGRLVPGYTRAMLIPVKQPRDPARERASIALLLAMIGADALGLPMAAGAAALVAAVLQGLRLASWRTRDTLRRPLLLILHLGFAWVALGLALRAAAEFTPWIARTDALHAITLGAVGSLTLGMMVRLTRTHGRLALASDLPTTLAFAAMTAAAVLRVFGPALAPGEALPSFLVAGALWIGALLLFLARYAAAGPEPARSERNRSDS